MRLATAVLTLIVTATTACASASPVRGSLEAVDRKTVASKGPAPWLVAEDGTACLTSESRFRRVRVGEPVWCHWTLSLASTPGADFQPD